MSREFQPGDVAMVSDPVHGNLVMVHIGHDPGGRCWHGTLGNGDLRCLAADRVLSARPLVVIDPEDAEAVKRLTQAHCRAFGAPNPIPCQPEEVGIMRTALREFADPKPPPCGASLSVTYGDGKGREQECHEPRGHDGPHASEDFRWTAHYGGASS